MWIYNSESSFMMNIADLIMLIKSIWKDFTAKAKWEVNAYLPKRKFKLTSSADTFTQQSLAALWIHTP